MRSHVARQHGQPAEELRVAVARHHLRGDRLGRQPEPPAARRPRPRAGCWRTCRPRRTASRARSASRASTSARRPRPSSAYQPAHLRPNVIGSAWMPCVRPIIGVCLCRSACCADGGPQAVERREQQLGGVAQLHREGGVDHVARRESEVEEPALVADASRPPTTRTRSRRASPRPRSPACARRSRARRAAACAPHRQGPRRARPARRPPPARPRASAASRASSDQTQLHLRPRVARDHPPPPCPVLPKPPSPRSLAGSAATSRHAMRATGATTSCAMRSPRRSVDRAPVRDSPAAPGSRRGSRRRSVPGAFSTRDAGAQREAAARPHLRLVAGGQRDRDAGRHEGALARREARPRCGTSASRSSPAAPGLM